jgi:hypothetical protein
MKTSLDKVMVAAVAMLAAAGAGAQEATSDAWMNVKPVLTRAEVRAELDRLRERGDLAAVTGTAYAFEHARRGTVTVRLAGAGDDDAMAPIGKSRMQVSAELQRARSSGELARLNAEAYDFAYEPIAAAPQILAARR